eukprot:1386394-Rhodomonas_salina.2
MPGRLRRKCHNQTPFAKWDPISPVLELSVGPLCRIAQKPRPDRGSKGPELGGSPWSWSREVGGWRANTTCLLYTSDAADDM